MVWHHLTTQKNTKVEPGDTFLQNDKIPINLQLFVSKKYGDNMKNDEKQQVWDFLGMVLVLKVHFKAFL